MGHRLFVDVDDTLVIYEDSQSIHPYGVYKGEPWHVNERLLEGIKQFAKANPHACIVVWSGGGGDYAEEMANHLGLEYITIGLIKDETTYHLIREGDIVVDDQPLGGHRTHTPDKWPEEKAK